MKTWNSINKLASLLSVSIGRAHEILRDQPVQV